MSAEDRGTLLGAIVRVKGSRSGRRWTVHSYSATTDQYLLVPIGGDVQRARNETTGKWQGGVRSIRVPYDRLQDRGAWEVVARASWVS